MKMKNNMLVSIMIILVLYVAIILVATLYFYTTIEKYSEEKIHTYTQNTIKKAMQNVDYIMNDLDQIAKSVQMDLYISSYFSQPLETNSYQWIIRENDIKIRLINYYKRSRDYQFDITLCKGDDTIITTNSSLDESELIKSHWFIGAKEKDQDLVITTPHALTQSENNCPDKQNISLIRKLNLGSIDKQELSYIIVDLDFNRIEEIFKDVSLHENDNVMLFSEQLHPIISSQDNVQYNFLTHNTLKQMQQNAMGSAITEHMGTKHLMTHEVSDLTDWLIVAVVPISDNILIRNTTIFMIICCLAMFVVMSYVLITKMIRPIVKIQNGMKKVEQGVFDTQIYEVNSWNEINALSNGFNSMTQEISHLVHRLIKEENEKRDIQLQILQSQINPHFLYNTLNSIRFMAQPYGATDIMATITSLVDLLRMSISNPNEFITLKSELKNVEQYINIQRLRYGDGIEMTILYDSSLAEFTVPKLIIQPLVENALFHGVEPNNYRGNVSVRAKDQNNIILVSVHDDGVGIDSETLKSLQKELQCTYSNSSSDSYSENIGLRNIDHRLKLLFGHPYGITIESEKHCGTTVTISMPKIKGNITDYTGGYKI